MRTLLLLFPLVAACSRSTVPDDLVHLEEVAEHAYDKALAEDFDAVDGDASTLAASWKNYRAIAEADGAQAADLRAMDAAIEGLRDAVQDPTRLHPIELGRAANAVSGPMDELFALYRDPIPPDILALDCGGREVTLDAMAGEMPEAIEDIGALRAIWRQVGSQVRDAGGAGPAEAYAASLDEQNTLAEAGDASGLRAASDDGLELVDRLEEVFEN